MPRTKKAKPAKSLYSVHPSLSMVQGQMEKLKERTGKTLDEWVREVIASGPPTEKERRVWLKEKHGLTVVVENRGGANGTIGGLVVRQATPDILRNEADAPVPGLVLVLEDGIAH